MDEHYKKYIDFTIFFALFNRFKVPYVREKLIAIPSEKKVSTGLNGFLYVQKKLKIKNGQGGASLEKLLSSLFCSILYL